MKNEKKNRNTFGSGDSPVLKLGKTGTREDWGTLDSDG